MKRIRYQVRAWRKHDVSVNTCDWTDNMREAKKQARARAHYQPCNVGPNLMCNCDKCLQHRNIDHIEIWRHKVDSQGDVKYWEGDEICCYSKESTGWTWTVWKD